MAELSIDLMWTYAADAEFPNRHTITFSSAQQVESDAAPDWGGSESATNPEQALAAAMASISPRGAWEEDIGTAWNIIAAMFMERCCEVLRTMIARCLTLPCAAGRNESPVHSMA